MSEYKIKFYKCSGSGQEPAKNYVVSLNSKDKAKVEKYIEYLRLSDGYLSEPYSRHIKDKIRELRVDFSFNMHRIFYFTFIGKNIILLHAFLKRTLKTPVNEINKAMENYYDTINNPHLYE